MANGMQDWQNQSQQNWGGNLNELYRQLQQPNWLQASAGVGYDLGSALQGAMGQIGQINDRNTAANNVMDRNMTDYRSMVDPAQIQSNTAIQLAQIKAQNARDLASAIFGGSGFGGAGGFGTGGGGLGGFTTKDGAGNPSSSAYLPGYGPNGAATAGGAAGGGNAGAVAQAGPPASSARPTPAISSYGQRLGPEDSAAAMERYRLTGHYSPMHYAGPNQRADLLGR